MKIVLLVIILSIFSWAKTEYIKGEMVMRNYNPMSKLWEYKVEAIDTANGKLSSAKFSSPKRIMYLGDIVYCIINDGKLQEIFLIGKAQKRVYPKKQSIFTPKVVAKKQQEKKSIKSVGDGWKKQRIELPKVETIDLD